MDLESFISLDDDDVMCKLYELGELHVGIDAFTIIRDHANCLAGSVSHWLEGQSEKSGELANEFAGIMKTLEETEPSSVSLDAFVESVLNRKIGKTDGISNRSYCVRAFLAYRMYCRILRDIMNRFGIPITERDNKMIILFDAWLEEGFYKDCESSDETFERTQSEKPEVTDKLAGVFVELRRRIEKSESKEESFRAKVTASCPVCKSLDDACRVSS